MTEPHWLTADERAAWLRFVAVLQLLPAALDTQLNRDEQLTHFEYFCLAMLSEAPERTLRMTALAARTNATLPRLSRVIAGLESAGAQDVTLKLISPLRPGLLESADGSGFLYLIMPIRLNV